MLENVADGFLGLFMFFTHWISSGNDQGEIRIAAIREFKTRSVLECEIDFDWNDRMSDLVDAGIPLHFRLFSCSDKGDTTVSVRTLFCDVGDYSYYVTDSIGAPPDDSVSTSRSYQQIYRAVREFQHLTRSFSKDAASFQIEAVLLPSKVSHLNRSIDMSDICGFRKLGTRAIKKPLRRGKP